MESPVILDLSEVDPQVWRVTAGETVYGPYTLGQVRAFVAEGRVAAHSLVSEGTGGFRPAAEMAALRDLFVGDPAATEPVAREEPSNMLVVIQATDTRAGLVEALSAFGPFVEAMAGTLLLKTTERLAVVRAALETVAAPGDRVVIVDATANRIAWIGMEPVEDRAVREVWS